MNIAIETNIDEFRGKISDLLRDEPIDADAARSIAERVTNIASSFFEVPSGIAEIRATVKSFAVDSDCEKEIKVVLSVLNTQSNKVKLALIGGDTVIIRALQSQIETESINK